MDKDKIDKKDHILDVAERVFADLDMMVPLPGQFRAKPVLIWLCSITISVQKKGFSWQFLSVRSSSFRTLLQNIGNDDSMTAWCKLDKCIDNYVERIIVTTAFKNSLTAKYP
jgi:hypothetical protein